MGGTCGACAGVRCGNLKERDDYGDLDIYGDIILKSVLSVIFLSVRTASGI